MDMGSPASISDVETNSLRQNTEHQTCELRSENTENSFVEAIPSGPENVDLENGSISVEHDEEKSCLRRNLERQACELKSENTENGSAEAIIQAGSENVEVENGSIPMGNHEKVLPKSQLVDVNNELANSPSKSSVCKRKKVSSKIKSKRYPLRSLSGGNRVLRSRSDTIQSMVQPAPITMPANQVTRGRKKRRKVKGASNDEFSLTRKRVRYLLTRMSYEQNLIDAYSGEGWKGQSAEKIRPEKEIQRAKGEILRCKYKIRELFQILDSLSSEGKFQESLFDSEGQIDSEDIFCAKCGLKDSAVNNDIILCDGICDRGFHQKCLNPPLLTEEIPLDDEGWLCPACDCKVDCIELLNETQGYDMSIEDPWEKVFPEAGPNTDGDKQDYDLPSDDSEDTDYNPDGPADLEDHKEKSDTDTSNRNKQNENFGFPSDDSEDDEYDPDVADSDKSVPNRGLSSDESDFTSDSDEFCDELSKTSGANEDSVSSLQNLKPISHSEEGRLAGDSNNSGLLSTSEQDLNQDNVLLSGKRHLERLDYKKLYDETYGKSSSDSSDDEDWSESAGTRAPNTGKKHPNAKESNGTSKARARTDRKKSNDAVDMSESAGMRTPDIGKKHAIAKVSNGTSKARARTHRKESKNAVDISTKFHETTPSETHPPCKSRDGENEVTGGCQEPDPDSNGFSASAYKRLGEIATKTLHRSFQENQYPTRQKKESLAEELGLTLRQVVKWFDNARHSFRASAKEAAAAHGGAASSPNKNSRHANNSKTTRGNNSMKVGKRTKSKEAGSENVTGGESIDGGDTERDKAIARELKKIKQSR